MITRYLLTAFTAGFASGIWTPGPAAAQDPGQAKFKDIPMVLGALAGQSIPVLPLGLIAADPRIPRDSVLGDPVRARQWADGLIAEALMERGGEVKWVLPPDLRRRARRGAGLIADPDHLGQALLRDSGADRSVPEPLRSSLRSIAAVAGDRYVLVPAAVTLVADSTGGISASISMVMVNARIGRVEWRTWATGAGPTLSAALRSALATVLPLDLDGQ
ncbi:MAG: hypothetical protein ACOY71_04260 [Gemmatimonadota bacterium]